MKTPEIEVLILGKTVVIENTNDNNLVANMIPIIEKDIKANIKENVVIFKEDLFSWSIRDNEIIRYEDLTESKRQKMTTQSRVSISMKDLNNLIGKGISLMMINTNLQEKLKEAI